MNKMNISISPMNVGVASSLIVVACITENKRLKTLRCALRNQWPSLARCSTQLFSCLRSFQGTNLTNRGKDLSAFFKLAEVLPSTQITSLKCAPELWACGAGTVTPGSPLTLLCTSRSLQSTYPTDHGDDMRAITKLAEILPSTNITSLECALWHRLR